MAMWSPSMKNVWRIEKKNQLRWWIFACDQKKKTRN